MKGAHPFRRADWEPLPTAFLMWAVAGVMLVELVATEVFSGRSPLVELAAVRAFELLWLLATAWRCRCLPLLSLQWPDARALRVFAVSAAAAFAVALTLAALAWLIEGERLIARLPWLGPAPWLLSRDGFLVMVVLAPFVEELFFRGVLYRLFRQAFGWMPAVAASAVVFAAAHGVLLSPQLAGGVLFALAFEWSRNLWVAILLHAGANFAVWCIGLLWPQPF
ncbi:MAG: CPBP family intramembrane glutamic endopeptidase [Mariprofundaceae bacterium]